MSKAEQEVLVTGATGFIGSNCVKALLAEGYKVRGTVRNLQYATKIDPVLAIDPKAVQAGRLTLVEAELLEPKCWNKAVTGCTYVIHTASPHPFCSKKPKDENELIKPAVEGTLNVLRAAAAAGTVKRVVMTSDIEAICMGNRQKLMTDKDWSIMGHQEMEVYSKSKTLAEREAWNFINQLKDSKMQLTTLCPTLVLGPMLHSVESASAEVVKGLLTGDFSMLPEMSLDVIDIRDVAMAHVRALTVSGASNERIILSTAVPYGLQQMAADLAAEFNDKGYKVTSCKAPYCIMWFGGLFDKSVKAALPTIGAPFQTDNTKMKELLKIVEPIGPKKATIDMAYSLIEKGIVAKTAQYKSPKA